MLDITVPIRDIKVMYHSNIAASMATIRKEILRAAHADGLLASKLSKRQRIYLHPSVVTAASIHAAIKESGPNGLDYDQLVARTKLVKSTCSQYAQWLRKVGLIVIEEVDYGKKKDFGDVKRAILSVPLN
jgi:hypothetical protein